MRGRFSDRALIFCALVVAVGIGAMVSAPPAEAHSPTAVLVAAGQAAPAVGPAFVDSFSVDCTTTATAIRSAAGSQLSYSCQTPASAETAGTVLVAVGDSGIADPAIGTRNSPVYSGDTIREWGGNATQEFCRSDTGTVVIYCRALVAVLTPP